MNDDEIIDYDRLRSLVERGLPSFKSPRWISMRATGDKNPDLIRNLLTGTNPQLGGVVGICSVMKIPLKSVMIGLDDEAGEAGEAGKEWLIVNGDVEAGVFRAQAEWGPEEWYEAEVEVYDDGRQHHGLIVRGRSMDRRFPPGTILRVEDVITSNVAFGPDDYVIVEQRRGDLVELTCKLLRQRPDGAFELVAESYLPEYDEPMFIGRPIDTRNGPSFDQMTDDETRVRAVVVDAYLPLRRRRTRPIRN